ncbi:MAG: nitrite reductase/ring-hydroxylating ferredoxin subunit [Planctomycetota bacterium]|jgi:nitrite reductase/ring-hydroxylating ferredoxin subunit
MTDDVPADAPGEDRWQTLCRLEDLPTDGSGRSFEVGSVYVALFRVDEQVHAIDDGCPHAGASLGLGLLSRGEVTCPGHALHFDLCTGRSSDGDGERVRVWRTRVDSDGQVQLSKNSPGFGCVSG